MGAAYACCSNSNHRVRSACVCASNLNHTRTSRRRP
ncbi:hypothetical protein STRAU_4921 [Streptomyces aurantiacus JA 4570]|uniref:Uncharacterized protein n=1 Tax=Streptomyces aurantiacus JA 4570 TaxID=1286094 RepID=S3ZH75_9ACTN|nr:hypothetical protein STRAU_4921 [Streptomyces aurantiacus JA 4570]